MQIEKLQKWAFISEIVGGLAVLTTLIFIVFEIRENTEVNRADNYSTLMTQLNDWGITLASNPELLQFAVRIPEYRSGSIADEFEFRRFSQTMSPLWNIYESAYFFNKYGLIGPSEWERFYEKTCDYMQYPDYYRDFIQPRLSNEFADFMENEC